MIGVLVGFAIIGAIILIGYIVGRAGVLGENAHFVLSRIVFYVLSPCLFFTVLADADVHVLFSSLLLVSLIAAVCSALAFALVARLFWKRPVAETVIGSMGAGYVNGNNIGIPVSLYVLGDAAYSAPVVLLQLLVFTPIVLTILDSQERSGGAGRKAAIAKSFANPIIIGALLGTIVAIFDIHVPVEVLEPFRIIGMAAIPVVLIGFGMSLHGRRPLAPGTARRDVLLATALKLAFMPLVAWLIGHFAFGLGGGQLFAVVVLAGLPSAQNVFNYAQRYERGEVLARDVVLITTVLSVPVLVGVAALLAP